MNRHLGLLAVGLLATLALASAAEAAERAWLDGKVIAVGHFSADGGKQIPTATVLLFDPGNSNPLARQEAWVITLQAFGSRKTRVELTVGMPFRAYKAGETTRYNGSLVIRYVDEKGHEKGEWHPIMTSLTLDDIAAADVGNSYGAQQNAYADSTSACNDECTTPGYSRPDPSCLKACRERTQKNNDH